MNALHRSDTRLRYRFATLAQARHHVREAGGRSLFFFAHKKLALLPGAPVCLELCFDDGEPHRMMHGSALLPVEGRGQWLDLADTRPVRELCPTEYTRSSRRLGCDLDVSIDGERCSGPGRLLELSTGGARLRGGDGLKPGDRVELTLLAPERRHLSGAFVAWVDRGELGVRFDRLDGNSRTAVARLVAQIETEWGRAVQTTHPAHCCRAHGLLDPPLPLPQALAAGA